MFGLEKELLGKHSKDTKL